VSGSGISGAICKSAPCSRQITTPAPHHSVFYRPDALSAAQPTASKHRKEKEKNKQREREEKGDNKNAMERKKATGRGLEGKWEKMTMVRREKGRKGREGKKRRAELKVDCLGQCEDVVDQQSAGDMLFAAHKHAVLVKRLASNKKLML